MGSDMSSDANNNKNQAQTTFTSSVPIMSSLDNSKLLATSVDSSNTNQEIQHQYASNVYQSPGSSGGIIGIVNTGVEDHNTNPSNQAGIQGLIYSTQGQPTTYQPIIQQQGIKTTQQANVNTMDHAGTAVTTNVATTATTVTTGTSPELVDYATEELITDIGFAHSVSFFNNINACSGTGIHFENAGYNNNILGDYMTGTNKPIIAKINPNTTLKIYSKNNKNGQSFYYENPYMDRYIVVKLPNNFVIKSMDIRPYSASIAAEVTEGFSVSPDGIFISTNDILLILLIIALIWIWYYYCD